VPTAPSPATPAAAPTTQREQMTKLRDANSKYKNLLKLAKERIQKQEDNLQKSQDECKAMKDDMERERNKRSKGGNNQLSDDDDTECDLSPESCAIIRVCQRVKVEADLHNLITTTSSIDTDDGGDNEHEIWALIEYEQNSFTADDAINPSLSDESPIRFKRWKKFQIESSLSDYVLRDTGETITLPPYSLTPDQGARIEREARQAVSHVTEEYRRYRIKTEVKIK